MCLVHVLAYGVATRASLWLRRCYRAIDDQTLWYWCLRGPYQPHSKLDGAPKIARNRLPRVCVCVFSAVLNFLEMVALAVRVVVTDRPELFGRFSPT